MKNSPIDLIKINEESLSPEAYLKLSAKEKMNIDSTKIMPAQLGKADFGQIHVIYKTPTYRHKNEQ